MTREELHAAVDAIADRELSDDRKGGRAAGHALVDALPDRAFDARLVPMPASDDSGCLVLWLSPSGPHPLLTLHHGGHGVFVASAGPLPMDEGIEWHGMLPGFVEVHEPEAAAVLDQLLARFVDAR